MPTDTTWLLLNKSLWTKISYFIAWYEDLAMSVDKADISSTTSEINMEKMLSIVDVISM